MARLSRFHSHKMERGISLALVVISIFALFGVMALVIDVVTLYVAKADAQRSANAAALAGVKALVDGGVTADPTNSKNQWDTACDLALVEAQRIVSQSKVGGATASLTAANLCYGTLGSACSTACPNSGLAGTGFGVNPQVGVKVQSTVLPLFFAKFLGQSAATVSASALAEGFNSSGTSVPVASKGVLPWLIPNADPMSGGPIIDTSGGGTDGQIVSPGPSPSGIIGEQIALTMGCTGSCATQNPPAVTTPNNSTYYPLDLDNPSTSLPSCFAAGTVYETNVAVNNPTPMKCGDTVTLDTSVSSTTIANETSLQCRIGASGAGLGNGQDTIDTTSFPFQFGAGTSNPLVGHGVAAADVISSSRAVVTIPVYNAGPGPSYLKPSSPIVVIGFVQGFVEYSGSGNPTIRVLNVSGCGTAAQMVTTGVGSDGESAVPVRLIHP